MRELTYFPLEQRYPMTSAYGYRVDPITGAQGDFHGGVDYGAPHGSDVIAPFDGEVTTGYESGGAGNWSWVVNGSDMFKSFHHAGFAVSSGWVTAGTVIAWIDSTGASTGSHAHLELWDHGTRIDPTGYFDRAPVKGQEDWFAMASEEDLKRIVHDEVAKLLKTLPLNAMWTDGHAQYEVTFNGAGQRLRRRIKSTEEYNLLKVGRAVSGDWVVDVSDDPDIFLSWPCAPE